MRVLLSHHSSLARHCKLTLEKGNLSDKGLCLHSRHPLPSLLLCQSGLVLWIFDKNHDATPCRGSLLSRSLYNKYRHSMRQVLQKQK
jgi:hypothetical protein